MSAQVHFNTAMNAINALGHDVSSDRRARIDRLEFISVTIKGLIDGLETAEEEAEGADE